MELWKIFCFGNLHSARIKYRYRRWSELDHSFLFDSGLNPDQHFPCFIPNDNSQCLYILLRYSSSQLEKTVYNFFFTRNNSTTIICYIQILKCMIFWFKFSSFKREIFSTMPVKKCSTRSYTFWRLSCFLLVHIVKTSHIGCLHHKNLPAILLIYVTLFYFRFNFLNLSQIFFILYPSFLVLIFFYQIFFCKSCIFHH